MYAPSCYAPSLNSIETPDTIAIVGMAGRFPQAATLDEFWRNLREGREAVSFFEPGEVQWLPLEHPPLANDPHFVRARAALDRPEWFDAAFFNVKPREAAMLDPQHRLFLECAWEALESAGCNPEEFGGSIGVFAGSGVNTYLFNNLLTNRSLLADYGVFAALTLNDKDYLSTRVAYKLNLRGPALNVQTACSTALVAVCVACQNLLTYQCDVALAGGVSISFPANRGHHHVEGGIMSRDGHCRAFDAKASGTVSGSGAGVVVLKRLSDAISAGDRICAVIKGHAVNNDGGVKMGFTAPSVDGQAECIAAAQAMAAVEPGTITYIEAHGTGTPLGDPIEVAALTKAFGPAGRGFCALGSVKTNIGHLDVAAGVAGLIKTTLALQHGEIPASLHFETPNPEIDFEHGPFFVNQQLRPWPRGTTPRRAGVSSFGIGGTNAHVVLEEAPVPAPAAGNGGSSHLLLLSARTPTALHAATENLAVHLEQNPSTRLADVAFTLQVGRKAFEHRRAWVVHDLADAVRALRGPAVAEGMPGDADAKLVFMFPGQGAQAVNMLRQIYDAEPAVRHEVEVACDLLAPKLGLDLRDVIFPGHARADGGGEGVAAFTPAEAARLLAETRFTQPALFVVEHVLASRWMRWGIQPAAMIGHSLGEYVAACLAGVLTLDDALALVAERGRLMQAQPAGAMIAIRASEAAVTELLGSDVTLAAMNAPHVCVVAGSFDAIDRLEEKLKAKAMASKRLATSHAFHSPMMEPAVPAFTRFLRRLVLRPPQIPWISNVTGTWITPQQATSPEYWALQLCRPVRFADGIGELVRHGHRTFLEVGPGRTLTGLIAQHSDANHASVSPIASLSPGKGEPGEVDAMLHALGRLWVGGAKPDWRNGLHREERRTIVPLPTYPFERQRHWIEPATWTMRADSVAPAADALPSEPRSTELRPVETAARTRHVTSPVAGPGSLAVLQQLFQELSGMEMSGSAADRTFAELGFDSLFLSQACVTVNRRFGLEIAARQLRDELPTLRQLAARVDRDAVPAGAVAAVVAGEPPPHEADVAKRIPLTEAQREIWMACQLGEAAAQAYTESATMQIRGPFDVDALRRAVRQLAARHEALRTTFAPDGETQAIAPAATIELTYRDCEHDAGAGSGGAAAAAARTAACIDAAFAAPFDLTTGPLLRAILARCDARNHQLALIVHHIVCDGWSLGILLRELADLYAAEKSGQRPLLAVAPRFSDYAEQLVAENHRAAFVAAESYWRETFADAVPLLELPTDRPRVANRSFEGDFVGCTLPPDVCAAVRRFAAERGCTVFTALLAVFSVLMHRLSGQDDIVVGVPTAAQALDGQPDLVGHFANLVPIRSRLGARQSFGAHLAEVQRTVSQALVHGQYPFVRLLQQLKLPRDGSRVPLAPVLFNTTHHRGTVAFAEANATLTIHPKRFVNFDLNFNLSLTGDALAFGCYYSTELFEHGTICRWFGHFTNLLRSLLDEPETCVAEVSLLTPKERQVMLVDWNGSTIPYSHETCVHQLFEEQVRRTPDAIALIAGTERIRYNELNRRADKLAAQLRAAGVRPDVPVGICLERTPHLLVAMLSVLKAGGAYVPLEPTHPPERLGFIVADTGMPVIITQHSLLAALPTTTSRVILVREPDLGPATPDSADPRADAPTADNLAYIIYTSGSTGRPKGVGVRHGGVMALAAWARAHYRPEELGGVLFATSASFDVSVFESLVPLAAGGTVVLAGNILQLAYLPAAGEVTLVSGVPSAVAELVRARGIPGSVRTINVAGEPCPQSLVDALYALPHIERVYDLYGPTETTVYSTFSLRQRGGRATIGRPLPNEQVYILDHRQQPVPIGVPGELFIGGDKLARGYLGRPELTAERFIELPILPGQRLYRTGDRARFQPDGTIEYLGRTDHQVKLRGYRIELGEIEAAVREHPSVADVVAMVRTDDGGPEQLVAYVVPQAGQPLSPAELREHASKWLPAPMVPATFVVLEQLPRTTSGKVDRRALPAPAFEAAVAEPIRPRNAIEETLIDTWTEVLGVDRVGVHDNFFALGGHSLHAMQVIARVHVLFGVDLTLRDFFATPTIAGLAAALAVAAARDQENPRAESTLTAT